MKKSFCDNFAVFFAVSILIILASCKSDDISKSNNAKGIFDQAMEYFEDEDYLDAQKLFDVVKFQYPASEYADDAQYYLAEISFEREEFIIAAYNYNSLRRIYPGSEHYKESMYKSAQSYYMLSPTFDRDQNYTHKAIKALKEFQSVFPNDSLSQKAGKKIKELRNKLARLEFQTAELYIKLKTPSSSVIYYDFVIQNYPDSDYFEKAYFGKIKVLQFMKKYEEAQSVIIIYKNLFKNGQYSTEVANIEKEIKPLMTKE